MAKYSGTPSSIDEHMLRDFIMGSGTFATSSILSFRDVDCSAWTLNQAGMEELLECEIGPCTHQSWRPQWFEEASHVEFDDNPDLQVNVEDWRLEED